MIRFRVIALTLPALALLLAGVGCGGSNTKATVADGKGTATGSASTTSTEKKGMTAVEAKATATIKGTVVYDGDPPKPEKLKFGEKAEKGCHEGDTESLVWEVDANTKGVKNVVIWVRAGDNRYFAVPEALKKRTDEVTMDQPHCNFKPHVVALNPSTFDGSKQVPTGQKFTMKNSADFNHNSKWDGANPSAGNGGNKLVSPKGSIDMPLNASGEKQAGREDRVNITCNVHPWMTAVAWTFDHPYYAVTDAQGNFEIKNVPADAEIYIVAWHEETGKDGFILPTLSPARQGEMVKLTAGETKELKLKIKKN